MLACASTFAIDLGKPKLPGMGGSAAAPAAGDALAMQEGVVRDYVAASLEISAAQLALAKAFDLKDAAAKLEAQITALKSGATLDKDAIEKQKKLSEEAQAAIGAKIAENAQLTEEGKKYYAQSLPPFASGLLLTTKMPEKLKTFSDAAKSQIGAANMMEKAQVTTKLSAGTYLAKELPGYTQRLGDSFKKIVTYAQKNSLPVPADATDVLSKLG
jgi:hypothetical protein